MDFSEYGDIIGYKCYQGGWTTVQLGYDRIMLILGSNNGEVPPAKMKPQHCCGIQHEVPGCLKVDATNS